VKSNIDTSSMAVTNCSYLLYLRRQKRQKSISVIPPHF